MLNRSLPYLLEDRTGHYAGSDFDEIYDRLFLHVSRSPPTIREGDYTESTLVVYDTGRRSSSRRQSRPALREPSAIMELGANGALRTIPFPSSLATSMPMSQYLRKTSMFAGSLSRKFTASNGEDYRWIYQGVKEHEWTYISIDISLH
ncbi:hypothetical protein C8Q73DRAFT_667299 [Cubamyces lactineus]|nr:hypothetical protein C8Q73DRAFT_667299 [Cubamyces lactineus]